MQKPHISFSELKDWSTCAFYHKLVHHDKLKGFKGNEYTAFGSAIHTVCEKKLLVETPFPEEDEFLAEFESQIKRLEDDAVSLDDKLVANLRQQGAKILPFVENALNEYFPEGYEVVSTEEQIMEPIEGSKKKFKGFIDAVIKVPKKRGEGYNYWILDWKTAQSYGWRREKKQ